MEEGGWGRGEVVAKKVIDSFDRRYLVIAYEFDSKIYYSCQELPSILNLGDKRRGKPAERVYWSGYLLEKLRKIFGPHPL